MNKFIFGVATSSFQIEGTHKKFESIWDTFCEQPNKIADHSNGLIACDHINRYKEDVQLIKELGVDSYRFSISWARIEPEKGEYCQEGIEFYRNLIHELKSKGIQPAITLYHWDMPKWVYQENGGWIHPDTVTYFVQYCDVIFKNFDSDASLFITINEPFVIASLGYLWGGHAPGHANKEDYVKAQYYVLLAHGKVVEHYKKNYNNKPIGITLNLNHNYTNKENELNRVAIIDAELQMNDLYLSPVCKGEYPKRYFEILDSASIDYSFMKAEEIQIMAAKSDFLGINYYSRGYVEYEENDWFNFKGLPSELPLTDMGWEVSPNALYDLIKKIRDTYTNLPIYITENGSAYKDTVEDNQVHDLKRIDYLNKHMTVVLTQKEKLNIVGYYSWSLMDNFEWAEGYVKRFGLVYVDYDTQKRIKKDSYYVYRDIIAITKSKNTPNTLL